MTVDTNRLYEVKEIITKNGGVLPMSLSGVYKQIREGQIEAVRVGKKFFIKGRVLQQLIA